MDWKSGSFSIVTSEGEKTVTGLVSDVFGIFDVGGRREHWAVTHIPTDLKLTVGNGCPSQKLNLGADHADLVPLRERGRADSMAG